MAAAENKHESGCGVRFNEEGWNTSKGMLLEWLNNLAQENSDTMRNASEDHGCFKAGVGAEAIFYLCDKLQLSGEAKYRTLEIFDRFMVQHVKDLQSYCQARSPCTRQRDWLGITERIKSQVVLRILSCCQLASKVTSHSRVVTLNKVRHLLQEKGHRYSKKSILQSEMRVLKTLEFKVTITTPLIFIEALLEILGYNDSELSVSQYYEVSLKILDFYYLQHNSIYEKLYMITCGQDRKSVIERARYAPVENDNLMLASAIIAGSCYIVDTANVEKIVAGLYSITRISADDIIDFSSVFLQLIQAAREP